MLPFDDVIMEQNVEFSVIWDNMTLMHVMYVWCTMVSFKYWTDTLWDIVGKLIIVSIIDAVKLLG